MSRMIAVVDLASGEVFHRPSNTLTLDVPADLDRTTGVVSLDPRSHCHYIATDGKRREYSTLTRPLSWRVRGEECLVADPTRRWASASCAGVYRLRAV
jgi:hypothetical protein